VDLGAVVLGLGIGVLAGEEHAGHGSDADLLGGLAHEDHALHVDDQLLAGPGGVGVGAGDAGAVQQGVEGDLLVPGLGGEEPELAEPGELLALGRGGVHGQAAGGEPVVVVAGHPAQVAGAQKDQELVGVVLVLVRGVEAEAGRADLLGHLVHEGVLP
jgi:hypothetical protein